MFYIYIYIYSHPQTDCFVVSQLLSVASQVRCFIVYIYIYIVLHRQTVSLYYNSSVWLDRWDVSYIYMYIYSPPQTDCFVLSQLLSVAREVRCIIYIYIYIYIVIHGQTVSLYHNSSVLLDRRDASGLIPGLIGKCFLFFFFFWRLSSNL